MLVCGQGDVAPRAQPAANTIPAASLWVIAASMRMVVINVRGLAVPADRTQAVLGDEQRVALPAANAVLVEQVVVSRVITRLPPVHATATEMPRAHTQQEVATIAAVEQAALLAPRVVLIRGTRPRVLVVALAQALRRVRTVAAIGVARPGADALDATFPLVGLVVLRAQAEARGFAVAALFGACWLLRGRIHPSIVLCK